LFFTDYRIERMLPKLLGKSFYSKKKHPVSIDFKKDIEKQIVSAKDSTYLYLKAGRSCSINVGKTNWDEVKLTENIIAAMDSAVQYIPKKWKNIQSVQVKSTTSVALPIYNSLPDGGLLKISEKQTLDADEENT